MNCIDVEVKNAADIFFLLGKRYTIYFVEWMIKSIIL